MTRRDPEIEREQERLDRDERWIVGALIVMGCFAVACALALVVL